MRRIKIGIDIGSSKTTIIVGELYDSGKNIKVLGYKSISSNGVKKGEILDIDLFSKTLKLGKEKLEEELGFPIKKATIGISSSSIKSSTTEVEYQLSDDEDVEVTEEHCNKILEISKKKVLKDKELILTKEVYNYRLDESGIMKNPIGKKGKKLEARVHLITIPEEKVRRVIDVLNKAQIDVESLEYNGEAGAKSALKKIDKVNGVALVDIGYGLTEITIYKNNRLINTNVIPLGGMHYINDLKYVAIMKAEDPTLKVSEGIARNLLEEVKRKSIDDEVIVTYTNNTSKAFSVSLLREVLDARTDEILKYVSRSIEASGYKDYLKNGVVLSGGVVREHNIFEKSKEIIGHEVRIGSAMTINGMNTELKHPSSITGMGIILTALEEAYKDLQESSNTEEEKTKVEEKIAKVETKKEKKEVKKEIKKEKKEIESKNKVISQKEVGMGSKIKKWLGKFV